METKKPGVKCKLLEQVFLYVFPQAKSSWKNSQGVFSPSHVFVTKRSICFSESPVSAASLEKFVKNQKEIDFLQTESIWGLCGLNSTRANKAIDTSFLLMKKDKEQHFTACGIVHFQDDKQMVTSVDMSESGINEALDEMKKEIAQYSERVSSRKAGCKRARPEEELPFASLSQSLQLPSPALTMLLRYAFGIGFDAGSSKVNPSIVTPNWLFPVTSGTPPSNNGRGQ